MGPATTAAVSAGNGQTATAGTAVPVAPAIIVRDALNVPVPGLDVVFAVTGGGGSLTGAVAQTNSSGIATVGSWTLGTTPGANTLTATVQVGGVSGNPVNFTATGTGAGPVVYTWTGATSGDWSVAGNWSPAGVPGSADDAVLTAAGQAPVLSTSVSATNVTVPNGVTLSLGGNTLTASGNVSAGTTITNGTLIMTGNGTTVQGMVPDLVISLANVTDAVTVAGPLTAANISAEGGRLVVGGQTVTVSNNLVTDLNGVLVMTNPAGLVTVNGSAIFGGENETGLLTAGTMRLRGSLTQNVGVTQSSFVASGTHKVILDGGSTGQVIRFNAPTQSRLQDLELANTVGGTSFFTDATIAGQLSEQMGPTVPVTSGGGFTVTVGGLDLDGADLGNLLLDVGTGVITRFDNVRFINYPETGIALRIARPNGTFTFNNLIFGNTSAGGPPTTGLYLQADDTNPSDGQALTINLANPIPATDGGFSQALNGAVINWPAAAPITWTGAVNSDWFTPGNWGGGVVPGVADDVIIPNVATTPVVTSQVDINALTIDGGRLDLGNNLVNVATSFQVSNGGLLVMVNPGDALFIDGNATFDGGNQLGFMTDGFLSVSGNFTQLATSSGDSFHPSGNHTTEMDGSLTGIPTVTFATPGLVPGTSHFQNFIWSGTPGGSLTLGSDILAHGNVELDGCGDDCPVGPLLGNGHTLTAGQVAAATGTVMDDLPLIIQQQVPAAVFLGSMTFQNLPTSATQITVNAFGDPVNSSFSGINFMPLTSGATGFYVSATDLDGASPSPLIIDILGNDPGNGPSFTQVAGGATVNWPSGSPVITWNGSVDPSWTDPANWTPNQVPGPTDDVLIPAGTPTSPIVANATIRNLVVDPGAILILTSGAVLDLNGDLDAAGSVTGCCLLNLHGSVSARGNLDGVSLGVTTGATVTLNGDLTMTNTGVDVDLQGTLIINGHALSASLARLLVRDAGGLLQMTNPSDLVNVRNAIFDGASTTGSLTAGTLQIRDDFTQLASHSGSSFFASGSHRTAMISSFPRNISFATPSTSRFQEFDISGLTSTLTLQSNVTAAGQLISLPLSTPPTRQHFGGATLSAGGADVTGLTLDGVPLVLTGGQISGFSNVTFQNQNPLGTHLTVNNVGAPSAFIFGNLNFTTALSAGGFYLVANDLDGASPDPLTIDVVSSNPASGAGVSQATNGAVINWPVDRRQHHLERERRHRLVQPGQLGGRRGAGRDRQRVHRPGNIPAGAHQQHGGQQPHADSRHHPGNRRLRPGAERQRGRGRHD